MGLTQKQLLQAAQEFLVQKKASICYVLVGDTVYRMEADGTLTSVETIDQQLLDAAPGESSGW
jgi:hypothetical protein